MEIFNPSVSREDLETSRNRTLSEISSMDSISLNSTFNSRQDQLEESLSTNPDFTRRNLDTTPAVMNADTPNISLNSIAASENGDFVSTEVSTSSVIPEVPLINEQVGEDIDILLPVQSASDSEYDQESPGAILQALRLKNVDRIVIGQLNINSIRNKIGLLGDLIHEKVDILLVSETKLDQSFPPAQFYLKGFSQPPYRLDRTKEGGGLLLYIRNDITSKQLSPTFEGIECIIIKLIIRKI